jgi:hypothetical protein
MAHHLFQTANLLGLQLYDLVLVTDRHPCRREVITGWLLLRLSHHALLPFWIRGCEMPLPRMNKIVTDHCKLAVLNRSRELHEVIQEAKQMASQIRQSSDLWDLNIT